METLTHICMMYDTMTDYLAEHSKVSLLIGSVCLDIYIFLVYLMLEGWRKQQDNSKKST